MSIDQDHGWAALFPRGSRPEGACCLRIELDAASPAFGLVPLPVVRAPRRTGCGWHRRRCGPARRVEHDAKSPAGAGPRSKSGAREASWGVMRDGGLESCSGGMGVGGRRGGPCRGPVRSILVSASLFGDLAPCAERAPAGRRRASRAVPSPSGGFAPGIEAGTAETP